MVSAAYSGLVASAVLGGTASVAGGGNFANGAVTGAFGYLFNTAAGALRGAAIGAYVGAGAGGAAGFWSGPADGFFIAAGQFGGAMLGAIIGDWATGPDVLDQTRAQIEKSIRSNEQLLQEHQDKLDAYRQDPDQFDNRGTLANAASQTIRDSIIRGRIIRLEREISGYQKTITALKGKL